MSCLKLWPSDFWSSYFQTGTYRTQLGRQRKDTQLTTHLRERRLSTLPCRMDCKNESVQVTAYWFNWVPGSVLVI